jgi:hypothetical protein
MKRIGIKPGTISWTAKEWSDFLVAARDIPMKAGDSKYAWDTAQAAALPAERRKLHPDTNAMVLMNCFRRGGIDGLKAQGIPNGAMPMGVQQVLLGGIYPREGSKRGVPAAMRPKAPSEPVIVTPKIAENTSAQPISGLTPGGSCRVVEEIVERVETNIRELPQPESQPPAPYRPDVAGLAADMISDVILRVLYNPEIRVALRNVVTETLAPESELEQHNAIVWRMPKIGREPQPRIVLVGGWAHTIEVLRRVKGVDWRFFGKGVGDESLHRLKALAGGADLAVIMTKNCGHPAEQSAKARAKDFIRWSGTDDGLIEAVNKWLSQWKEEHAAA